MKPHQSARLHTLELPLQNIPLIIPSAVVAEVINPPLLTPVPYGQPWLRGVIGWRTLAVPVVSFEALMGGAAPERGSESKVVIFYPMNGRREWEFYGVLVASEPRPQALDGSQSAASQAELPETPYIAAGIKIGDKVLAIPDLEAMKKTFYPG